MTATIPAWVALKSLATSHAGGNQYAALIEIDLCALTATNRAVAKRSFAALRSEIGFECDRVGDVLRVKRTRVNPVTLYARHGRGRKTTRAGKGKRWIALR